MFSLLEQKRHHGYARKRSSCQINSSFWLLPFAFLPRDNAKFYANFMLNYSSRKTGFLHYCVAADCVALARKLSRLVASLARIG